MIAPCALTPLLTSCNGSVSRTELIGGYHANTPGTSEWLVLNSSGAYKQTVMDKATRRAVQATGRWHYDVSNHDIVFESGFLLHWDPGLTPLRVPAPSEDAVVLTTYKVLGEVRIEEGDVVSYKHQ